MKKIIWSIVLVLVVLIVVAVIAIAVNLDRIVKQGVETYGPQITKVDVKLDAVHIGILTGSASIKGLVVGNPSGFKAPQAISVGKAAVQINPFSLLSDKIIVRSIKIESPSITFEGGLSGNNLTTIKNNVNGPVPKDSPAATNAVANPKASKTVEVDDFLITGAKVNGSLKLFGNDEIAITNLTLPDIHLTNLGTGRDGITAKDLSARVMGAIDAATLQMLTKYAASAGKGAVNLGSTNLNSLKQGIGNLFKK